MNMDQLPLFDLTVIAIVVLSLLLGLARGLVQELLSLLSWGGAAVVAWVGYPFVTHWFDEIIHNSFLRSAAAAALVFVVSVIVLATLARIIGRFAEHQRIRSTDRALGGIFGLARGYVICAGLFAAAHWIWEDKSPPAFLQEGKTLPYIAQGAIALVDVLSSSPQALALSQRLGEYTQGGSRVLELHQKLLQPDIAPPSTTDSQNGGYNDLERKELNKLFEPEL